jgi:predicted DNA-binding WGR domain protein
MAKRYEKTGGGEDHASRWNAIAGKTGKDLVAALEQEWAFMCETPKCTPVLAHLLTKVKSASVADGKLAVVFDDQYDGETTVTCSPPASGKIDQWPKSWQKFMTVYDGVEMDSNLDVPTYFNGTSGSNAFEQEYVEEVEPELYEKARAKEIEFEVPFDLGQDWVVANPFKKNKLGEPTLYFVSHEGGGFDEPYQGNLGLPAVWLRLMTQHITDRDFFEQSDTGEDDEGGSDTRRFEFSEDGSNKFWEIRVEGASHTVRFGKIGTDGQTTTKELESAAAARKDADKLIAEKTKKGYEEV